MQKIILIIIATIVNGLVGVQDESKLLDNCSFIAVSQHCNGIELKLETLAGTTFYHENVTPANSMCQVPPWNLFVNFKPISSLSDQGSKGSFWGKF
ncbi:hypothetical protein [Arenibacter sp. F20364]|uniref:hypothetical protein n=1 Tax=Arenibacter sp. F20364 TaxID=2926415 RepID=UPI001FF0E253|nr:hypothetical protein [Arenibacter sp. F20364]MCK0190146.1 hypothetical protein [Arenibacter sp. F20364]